VGYTKIINHSVAYHIVHDPCPQMVVQPTVDDAEGYSKEEIAPMLRDTPALVGLVSDPKTRSTNNTITRKIYPGGYLVLVGANSARGFRRITVRIVYFDEVDAYPPSAGSEGDQIKLGSRRTETFWNRKIIIGGTPTIKNFSRIEKHFHLSENDLGLDYQGILGSQRRSQLTKDLCQHGVGRNLGRPGRRH
jgi:phage terminase large subunit GpA-like protein